MDVRSERLECCTAMEYTALYSICPNRSLLSMAVLASHAPKKRRTKPAVFGAVFWHHM
jgi:hypothetical protein